MQLVAIKCAFSQFETNENVTRKSEGTLEKRDLTSKTYKSIKEQK